MPIARQAKPAIKRKKSIKKTQSFAVRADARISDILREVPDAAEIFAMHGLHCAGCHFQVSDTLEEGMALHGRGERELELLMEDLVVGLSDAERRPKNITITKQAAVALLETLQDQGKEDLMLLVMSDETGGFCMEFTNKKSIDHQVFTHEEVPGVRVIADTETLKHVGGSTIDFREGRFKLDMPSMHTGCACKDAEMVH